MNYTGSGLQEIINVIRYDDFDFSSFDCIIVLDSGNPPIFPGSKNIALPITP